MAKRQGKNLKFTGTFAYFKKKFHVYGSFLEVLWEYENDTPICVPLSLKFVFKKWAEAGTTKLEGNSWSPRQGNLGALQAISERQY